MSTRAVLVEPFAPLEIVTTEVPPAEPGGALVAVEMGGVCGTDVHFWRGKWPLDGPIVLGHEGVGRIAELGEGSTTDYAGEPIAVGDRVYWANSRPCHRCYACTIRKDFSLCDRLDEVFFTPPEAPSHSTYNDLASLLGGMPFFKVPEDVPAEAVIAFGCALPTMLQALDRLGGIRPGEDVVVQGSGPVGLAAALLARVNGAGRVGVIGAPERRLALARDYGADFTVDVLEVTDPAARIREVHDRLGKAPDLIIEAAGVLDAFPEGVEMLDRGGRYLIVGLWSGQGPADLDPRVVNNRNLSIIGSALGQPEHYYRAIHFARQNHRRYPMAEAVTHRFALADSQAALEAVEALETVKAVIVPS